jgi:hypothetical protein
MTSVGFGNVAPETDSEKVFTICMMIIGGEFGSVITVEQITESYLFVYQQLYCMQQSSVT